MAVDVNPFFIYFTEMTEPSQIAVTTSDWMPAPVVSNNAFQAIGDVHGCANLLAALRTHLDTVNCLARRIYLGDLIDPHPKREHVHDCAAVLDMVADDLDRGGEAIAGNHDAFFLIARAAGGEAPQAYQGDASLHIKAGKVPWERGIWMENGLGGTASAWGVTVRQAGAWGDVVADDKIVVAEIDRRMTLRQRGVMNCLKIWVDAGPYLLVHAGFEPHVRLDRQQERASLYQYPQGGNDQQHPLWMRFKHGTDAAPKGRVLIHGHTPTRRPILGRKRICIDTGAKYGGPLTALEVAGDRMRLHQAWPAGVDEKTWNKDGLR